MAAQAGCFGRSFATSTKPRPLRPFVGEARYAAELRNYYWRHVRGTKQSRNIVPATHGSPYPATKTDQCSDRAGVDGGGNFGRVARYGLLDEFVKSIGKQEISGIPVRAWLTFLKMFSDNTRDLDAVVASIESAFRHRGDIADGQRAALAELFERIALILKQA